MADTKKKSKVFELNSKQISEASTSKSDAKEVTVRDQRSAERELAAIRESNDANMGSIVKLSSSLRKTLDTAKTALPQAGVNQKEYAQVNDANILQMVGKFKSKEEAEAIITAKIEQATAQVSLYNHTGVYAKMLEARRNNFIEENLPITRTSLDLYVDDVNNGSFRGSEYGSHNKFKFYENGALITDMTKIDKMTEYLNPTSYLKLSDDVKSFDEIDARGDYLAYKHGNSDTRIISHKQVAKDMYIKYVLKEAKKQTVGKDFVKERAIVASTESALEFINDYVTSVYNLKPAKMGENLLNLYGESIIQNIPEVYYKAEDRYIGHIGNESIAVDTYTYNEFSKDETFLEFAERYLYGGCSRVYNVNPKANRDNVIDGYCFTFETESVSTEVANAIMTELMQEMHSYSGQISNESLSLGIESFRNTDPAYVDNMIQTVSFEEIYNTSMSRIAGYNKLSKTKQKGSLSYETYETIPDNDFLRARGATKVDKLYLRCFNALNRNEEISYENGIADMTLNPSYGMMELGGLALDPKTQERRDQTTPDAVKKVKEKRINYNKLEKQFGNIRGCTVEYLDNTRKIDLIAGNKKIGVYYIEYTHQDIQHFIGLRTILGNPITYTQNIDMLNIRTDEQEETLGRLIFSDQIKPLIEENMDTKFIRNNADIIYCLQKLMEENELSQSMSYNDLTRYSMYNLSRIIFIPANQCIFKRNGDGPLGESRFAQAMVPATSHILAKEAYLSWILCDAKGISFLTIPKGMSELGGEYGQDHLKDRIDDLNLSRAKLRDVAFNNSPLTHRFVVLEKGEEAEANIDIQTIEYPDFQIDDQMMKAWQSEYTSIIGMSSDIFANMDGTVELAKKMFELDDAQLMRVLKSRAEKKIPSSQLATRLLQERGGQEFKDVTVEWVEPSINVNNYGRRSEIVDELNKTIEAYMATYDAVYDEADERYKAARPYVVKELYNRLTDTDSLLTGMDDIVKDAIQKMMVNLTAEVSEKELDKQNEKAEGGQEDAGNDFNPDNAEQNAEQAGGEEAPAEDNGNPFA